MHVFILGTHETQNKSKQFQYIIAKTPTKYR